MAERKRRSTTGTTGSKTKGTTRSKTKRTTSKTGTSRKKSGTMSWMKYELWGLVLVVIGALVAAGTAGIDTGNIGLSLDDIFAYAFGTGRMLVALMLVAAGLQYIVKRKALPFTRNWLMGAVVFELLLSLWHVIFTNPGEEFVPPALRAGGGLFGAVPAAFLRSWFGGFGAVLALIVVLIGTVMIWKKVSLSKPVALAQEMTAEGVSHVSEKAVAGIQTASHSVQESWQRHKERKIFDVEREKDALGEGIAVEATAVTAEGAAEDN
ncbi:MAG: DNA translocase FtsK 4TM domain-containing protein, partial [Anaeroglobus sp.]